MLECVTVIGKHGLLGVFTTYQQAWDSLEYSYHGKKHVTVKEGYLVKIAHADGEDTFEVRRRTVFDCVVHL